MGGIFNGYICEHDDWELMRSICCGYVYGNPERNIIEARRYSSLTINGGTFCGGEICGMVILRWWITVCITIHHRPWPFPQDWYGTRTEQTHRLEIWQITDIVVDGTLEFRNQNTTESPVSFTRHYHSRGEDINHQATVQAKRMDWILKSTALTIDTGLY